MGTHTTWGRTRRSGAGSSWGAPRKDRGAHPGADHDNRKAPTAQDPWCAADHPQRARAGRCGAPPTDRSVPVRRDRRPHPPRARSPRLVRALARQGRAGVGHPRHAPAPRRGGDDPRLAARLSARRLRRSATQGSQGSRLGTRHSAVRRRRVVRDQGPASRLQRRARDRARFEVRSDTRRRRARTVHRAPLVSACRPDAEEAGGADQQRPCGASRSTRPASCG